MSRDRQAWFFGGSSLLLSFIILMPVLWFGFGADQGIFSYDAWAWRRFGLAPYTSNFEINFPGIFLIHLFVQAVLGESVTAFRVFDLLWHTASAFVIYITISSTFKDRRAGLLSALMYSLFYIKLGPWDSGQRDDFFPLLYLLAFLALRRQKNRRAGLSAPLLAGLFIGFAFIIRPVAGTVALVLLVYVLLHSKPKWVSAIIYCLGCSAPAAAVAAYYFSTGSFNYIYQILYLFNSKVYLGSAGVPLIIPLKSIFLLRLWPHNLAVIVGALLLAVLWKKFRVEDRSSVFWLLWILLATHLGFMSQRKYFIYHQAPVWGLLCMFAGAGCMLTAGLVMDSRRMRTRVRSGVFAGIMLLALASMIDPPLAKFLAACYDIPPSEGQKEFQFFKICSEAASYLSARSKPGDLVQVWGGDSLINFLAQRRAPTRFPQTFPLILKSRNSPRTGFQLELAQEFLSGLRQNPPVYFVIETMPHPSFGIASDKEVLVNDYPEIWKFVTANYLPESSISFIEIYRLSR